MAGEHSYVLTLSCPDRTGIVAAVSGFFAGLGGWIVESHNHADRENRRFFMREQVLASSVAMTFDQLKAQFETLATEFDMTWKLSDTAVLPRLAVLVTKEEHCLYDLLSRYRSGDLPCKIAAVIGNHNDLRDVVEWHGLPFHHVPIDKGAGDRAFATLGEVLSAADVDSIVLARYMQVLPPWLCELYAGRVLNIHHGFLPSFKGAKPYHQAHAKGVKLIGATCHYVTAHLDEGPIIEQDVVRVDHSDSVAELRRAGKDVEKAVLARGLRYHLEDRVLVDGAKTVVFR